MKWCLQSDHWKRLYYYLKKFNLKFVLYLTLCKPDTTGTYAKSASFMLQFPTSKQHNSQFFVSVTGGCIGNLLQSPSRQPLPVAASSFHCKTGTFGSKPQNTFPKPAQACFKPGLEVVAAPVMCPFCKKNGEMPEFYTTHKLKDCWGRVICPVLRAYTCPNCGVSGDNAHTVNYCPYK